MVPPPVPSAPASSAPLAPTAAPAGAGPRFLVGQDRQGCWVAVEAHGLAGGIFRSCKDAIRYAAGETGRRPDAVAVCSDLIEFRP